MKKTLLCLSCLTCLVFLLGISAVSAETVVSAPADLEGVLAVNSIDYTYDPEAGLLTKTYTLTNISGETLQNPKLVNLFLWSNDIFSTDWVVMSFDAFSTYANADQSASVANNDGFINWSDVVTPNTLSSTELFPDLAVQTVQQGVSYPYWNVPGFPTQWPDGHPAIVSLQFNNVPNCKWIQNTLWVVSDVDTNEPPSFIWTTQVGQGSPAVWTFVEGVVTVTDSTQALLWTTADPDSPDSGLGWPSRRGIAHSYVSYRAAGQQDWSAETETVWFGGGAGFASMWSWVYLYQYLVVDNGAANGLYEIKLISEDAEGLRSEEVHTIEVAIP